MKKEKLVVAGFWFTDKHYIENKIGKRKKIILKTSYIAGVFCAEYMQYN
jgi:hypothetical protein